MAKPFAYRQIADDVQQRIHTGEYPPGSTIPSYRELAKLHGVGASTVQRAVRELRVRGLAMGVPGRGVFVMRQ